MKPYLFACVWVLILMAGCSGKPPAKKYYVELRGFTGSLPDCFFAHLQGHRVTRSISPHHPVQKVSVMEFVRFSDLGRPFRDGDRKVAVELEDWPLKVNITPFN